MSNKVFIFKWKVVFILLLIVACKERQVTNNVELFESKINCIYFYLPNCIVSEAKLKEFIYLSKKMKNSKIKFTLVKLYSNTVSENFDYYKNNNSFGRIEILNFTEDLKNKYKISVVPYCFLIKDDNIIYQGSLDEEYVDITLLKKKKYNRYLENAINCTLAGKIIKTKKTEAVGCKI